MRDVDLVVIRAGGTDDLFNGVEALGRDLAAAVDRGHDAVVEAVHIRGLGFCTARALLEFAADVEVGLLAWIIAAVALAAISKCALTVAFIVTAEVVVARH